MKIPKGGNQSPYIEEEQTTQWRKEKVQKDKQKSTKHTYRQILSHNVVLNIPRNERDSNPQLE